MRIDVSDPRDVYKVSVELENISEGQYSQILSEFDKYYHSMAPAKSVTKAFLYAIKMCPDANPADLWWHVIYRTYLKKYGSDQSWKRTAGFALEDVFADFYGPLLLPYGIYISCIPKKDSYQVVVEMGISDRVAESKIDMLLRGSCLTGRLVIFGGIHLKSSIAERIQDDAPASVVMMEAGYWSGFVTLDSKAFPPPHGDAVVRGEFGLRTNPDGALKRNYFEKRGQFDNCYSYNTRTIPSEDNPAFKKRIYTLSFSDKKPDRFMTDIINAWNERKDKFCS